MSDKQSAIRRPVAPDNYKRPEGSYGDSVIAFGGDGQPLLFVCRPEHVDEIVAAINAHAPRLRELEQAVIESADDAANGNGTLAIVTQRLHALNAYKQEKGHE